MRGQVTRTRGAALDHATRQQIIKLVAAGLSYSQIADQCAVSANTVGVIIHRARDGHRYKSETPASEREAVQPFHGYRNLKPAKAPFAPDCSCPDFAHDELHCAAIYSARAGGYPVLAVRA